MCNPIRQRFVVSMGCRWVAPAIWDGAAIENFEVVIADSDHLLFMFIGRNIRYENDDNRYEKDEQQIEE